MKNCPYCEWLNANNTTVCKHCWESLSSKKVCPYCEGEISETARKCKHCWEWLDGRWNNPTVSTEIKNNAWKKNLTEWQKEYVESFSWWTFVAPDLMCWSRKWCVWLGFLSFFVSLLCSAINEWFWVLVFLIFRIVYWFNIRRWNFNATEKTSFADYKNSFEKRDKPMWIIWLCVLGLTVVWIIITLLMD